MGILQDIAAASGEVFLVASPFILIGLAGAGALHVVFRPEQIARWLGRPGLGSTATAALVGIPLPLCSCSVVPVTIELSRKGASREASLAFLVSTPETGVDSILVTYGLLGPVMAVARPLAALATSLVAGLVSLLAGGPVAPLAAPVTDTGAAPDATSTRPDLPRQGVVARVGTGLRYAFVTMVDEIGFWLVAGVVLTGVITAAVPDDLVGAHLGRGPLALVALLVVGIPLYMCASASTPVAAALVLKGVSPGAALVFLLAGPATNASSLVLIARFFGRSFVKIYLASVVAVALLAGYGFDQLLRRTGWSVEATLSLAHAEGTGRLFLASAALLAGLIAWSAWRGSWRAALRDLARDSRQWSKVFGRRGGAETAE